ncbi:hypothetical protein J6590_025446 [Homalodisca vitripennis]|nr:hypothetical protein J6590_025446 [Homalodisca vitripennis]
MKGSVGLNRYRTERLVINYSAMLEAADSLLYAIIDDIRKLWRLARRRGAAGTALPIIKMAGLAV